MQRCTSYHAVVGKLDLLVTPCAFTKPKGHHCGETARYSSSYVSKREEQFVHDGLYHVLYTVQSFSSTHLSDLLAKIVQCHDLDHHHLNNQAKLPSQRSITHSLYETSP